jgi:hypothetical protein
MVVLMPLHLSSGMIKGDYRKLTFLLWLKNSNLLPIITYMHEERFCFHRSCVSGFNICD